MKKQAISILGGYYEIEYLMELCIVFLFVLFIHGAVFFFKFKNAIPLKL